MLYMKGKSPHQFILAKSVIKSFLQKEIYLYMQKLSTVGFVSSALNVEKYIPVNQTSTVMSWLIMTTENIHVQCVITKQQQAVV